MKRAYSLIRFSSWKQAKGQSQRRQAEWSAAWCEHNGCLLDESLHQDKPVSAFRGANRSKGALAAFLEMIQVGRVARGSILLVESLDRLSREEVDEALMLFLGIIKAGVEIVTMSPERRYTKAAVGDIVGLLEPIIIMSRAHEESAIKSHRIADLWKQRRKQAAETPMNGVGLAWLRFVDGRWQVDEAKAAAVRRIFALAIEGHGLHAIAARLNKEGIAPIARGQEWVYSYIGKTLRNRAVLGELQPHVVKGKRTPIGSALPNYYPAIISEADFHKAAAALDARRNQKGPRGRYVRNLFTGLLRDVRDGCTLVTNSQSDKCQTVKLVSSGAQRGRKGSTYLTFPYEAVEDSFLKLAKELKASDVLPSDRGSAADEAAALSGRLKELEFQIAKTRADMQVRGEFDAGLQLLRELQDAKDDAAVRLEKVQAEAATNEAEVLGETQSLIDLLAGAAGEELLDLRTKIKARIRQLVREMWMLTVVRGRDRVAALQVWFTDGQRHRDLLIYYQPGHCGFGEPRVGRWWARSFAAVEGLDLRRAADAKKVEAALLALDLDVLVE
jgi:DNA invertase Pin-like site-specific DNA recombinase